MFSASRLKPCGHGGQAEISFSCCSSATKIVLTMSSSTGRTNNAFPNCAQEFLPESDANAFPVQQTNQRRTFSAVDAL